MPRYNMNQSNTKYFQKMLGMAMTPNSVVILGNRNTQQTILLRSYLNYVFDYLHGTKMELREDTEWTNLRHRKLSKMFHGSYMKHYRPASLYRKKNTLDNGLRILYDEYVLRRSNRHSQIKKIVYVSNMFMFSSKPANAMVSEILKDGGTKCNIQFIFNAIVGCGESDDGLLSKFDIRIATTPLSKADSLALFGSDKYATKKESDKIIFGYKNKVEEVEVFHHTYEPNDADFLNLIKSWSF